MRGGELSVWPVAPNVNLQERIGTVVLERGRSTIGGIDMQISSTNTESHTKLIVGQLDRRPGAVFDLIRDEQRTSIQIDGSYSVIPHGPVLENPLPTVTGMLPAWLIAGYSFSTYAPDGSVTTVPQTYADFATATADDIARPGTIGNNLTDDETVHAISGGGPIPLDGHTLTVGSGGISSAEIGGGTLQPGQYAGGELIFIGGNTISADIIDNGGPTSVIFTRGRSSISGNNTYSGTTYVVGTYGDLLQVNSPNALPTNADLQISGPAQLWLNDIPGAGTYRLGDVYVRDGGWFTAACCDPNSTDAVIANSIHLESGRLSVPLSGDFTVEKTTEGTVNMNYGSPKFRGEINIREGTVFVEADSSARSYLAFGSATVNVERGGRLVLAPSSSGGQAGQSLIQLNGGVLQGTEVISSGAYNFRGNVEVTENSEVHLQNALNDRARSGDFALDGRVLVHAGKSLVLVGEQGQSSGFQVARGIHLEPGAVLAGVGAVGTEIEIANGAVISPGLITPGNSIGQLNTSGAGTLLIEESLLLFGSGGRYRWEARLGM